MKNEICNKCGKQFKMGYNGTINGCDECCNIQRIDLPNQPGTAYSLNEPYAMFVDATKQNLSGAIPIWRMRLIPNPRRTDVKRGGKS
jgi:predicted  nucleic acid-binding Zn-ribbon protein